MADQFQLAAPVYQILGSMSDPDSLRRAIVSLANQANTAVNTLAVIAAPVVSTTVLLGQTAAIASTPIYTTPAVSGIYRATISMIVTTANAGATGSYNIQLTNNNGINANDLNVFPTGMPLTTAGNETSTVQQFYSVAGTPINLSTSATGSVAGGVYALRIVLEFLGVS